MNMDLIKLIIIIVLDMSLLVSISSLLFSQAEFYLIHQRKSHGTSSNLQQD